VEWGWERQKKPLRSFDCKWKLLALSWLRTAALNCHMRLVRRKPERRVSANAKAAFGYADRAGTGTLAGF
jgi:hypothetical protein